MGATSLGYNAAEWAADYQGYRTSTDPTFAEAQAVIADWREQTKGFQVIHVWPDQPTTTTEEDIPF
jgi:hypothetical protein